MNSIDGLKTSGDDMTDIKGFLNKKQMDDNSKGIAKDIVISSLPIKCSVSVKVEKCDHDSMNENGPVKEVVNYGGTFSMDECGLNISEPAGIGTEDVGKKYTIRKVLARNEKEIKSRVVPVKQYTITRTSILKAVEEQAKENTSLADKYLDIAVRNFYGECRDTPKTFHDKLIYDVFERWKDWYETHPEFRGSPLLYMCYICKIGWWRLHPFREHMKSHGENTFKIRTLPRDQEFYMEAFSNRVLRPIDINIISNCLKCGKPDKYHNFRRRTAKYKCKGCDAVFFTCNKLDEHEGMCMLYMKMKCDKLGVEMTSDFKTCPVCFRYCLTQMELDTHMTDRHSVHSDDPILMQAKLCSACNTKYHIYKFHDCPGRYKNIKCEFCFRKFTTMSLQYMHIIFSKRLVKCTVCDKSMYQCMLLEHMLHHSKNYMLVPWCSKCKNNLLHIINSFYENHIMKSHGRWVDRKKWGAKMLVPMKCITGEIVHSETVLNIPEKDLELFMSGLEDDGSNSEEVDDDIIILDDGGPMPVLPNESKKCDINTLQEQLDAEVQKYVEMDAAISKVFKTSNCYRRFTEKETEQPLEDNMYDDNDDDDLILLNNSDEVTIISDSDDENENENSKEFVEDNVKIINSIERKESNTNLNTKVKEEPNDEANISCRKDGTIEAHPEHNTKVDNLIAKDNSVIESYNVVKESHSGQSSIVKGRKEDKSTCAQNEACNTDFRTGMKEKLKHDNLRSCLGNGTNASYLQDKYCSLRHSIEVKVEPGDVSCLQDTELNLHHSTDMKEEREDEIIMSHSSVDSNASYPQDVEFNLNHTTEVKVEAIDDIVMFHSGDETALCPQEVHYDKVNKIGMKGLLCDAALSCGENKRLAKKKRNENLKNYTVTGVSDKGDAGEPIKEKHDISILNLEIFYACKKCPFRGCYNEYIEHITSSCVAMSFCCSTCTIVFSTLKLYVHHLTRHNYKFLTCPTCKQQFNEDSRLCSHIISHLKNFYMKSQDVQNMDLSPSQKNDILQCIECKKIIKSEQIFIHWDLHLKMKNDKRKADHNKDSDDEAEMNSKLTKELLDILLIKKTINMPRKCIVCNKTFPRPRDCKRHFIMHLLFQALRSKVKNNNQLLCQLCGADQNSPAKYKEHMREHASMAIYKCRICAKTFNDNSNYSKHMKVHNLCSFICDKCGAKFLVKKCLIDHLQKHEARPPATCLQCDMSFFTEAKLKRHLKYKHMRDCRYFACMICKKRLGSLKEKWDHMWLEHQERNIEADCSICNMKFRKISDLKQHLMEHEARPPATCLHCDMSFSTEAKLKTHLKSRHNRNYACIICKKRFGSYKDKWDHMWLEHQERKTVADCSLCNMKFRKTSDLQQHLMEMHEARPPTSCLQCDMSFSTAANLKRHLKYKHMREYFACLICEKRFGSYKDKRDHMWLEHQERKTVADCSLCNMKFRKTSDLKQHTRAHTFATLKP
ncbi:unnamed protein product [Parnassius apollo]|uniref:(apollo) hypothetical protein n=1 Tax=Parnassius apollo TaxID=110799 RepID=A0A8S3X3E0_PARAO|nr:unnamed protein product [Parnassius apollo]